MKDRSRITNTGAGQCPGGFLGHRPGGRAAQRRRVETCFLEHAVDDGDMHGLAVVRCTGERHLDQVEVGSQLLAHHGLEGLGRRAEKERRPGIAPAGNGRAVDDGHHPARVGRFDQPGANATGQQSLSQD